MVSPGRNGTTDREWRIRPALSALPDEINTRCVKSESAVRLVAIDEELILTDEAVLGDSDAHKYSP